MPQDAAYMREYRFRNPAAFEMTRAAGRARHRALRVLAGRHPDEFEAILTEQRAAEGLPPVGVLKRGPKRKDAA